MRFAVMTFLTVVLGMSKNYVDGFHFMSTKLDVQMASAIHSLQTSIFKWNFKAYAFCRPLSVAKNVDQKYCTSFCK